MQDNSNGKLVNHGLAQKKTKAYGETHTYNVWMSLFAVKRIAIIYNFFRNKFLRHNPPRIIISTCKTEILPGLSRDL